MQSVKCTKPGGAHPPNAGPNDAREPLVRPLQALTDGAPGGTRTPDPQLRRLSLYPAELLAQLPDRRSSCRAPLVGAPGFEPGTSCSQSRRDTRLRYAPLRPILVGSINPVNALT